MSENKKVAEMHCCIVCAKYSTFLSCIPRTAGLDPTKLNLNELLGKGALPDGLGQDFTLYVNAITQASPPVPDAQVTLVLGETIDEAMNTIQLGGTDWNDAVKAYNTRRAQIKGEIVARVSAYFGIDLPVTFPFYQGGNAGQPVQNPLATPIP